MDAADILVLESAPEDADADFEEQHNDVTVWLPCAALAMTDGARTVPAAIGRLRARWPSLRWSRSMIAASLNLLKKAGL